MDVYINSVGVVGATEISTQKERKKKRKKEIDGGKKEEGKG